LDDEDWARSIGGFVETLPSDSLERALRRARLIKDQDWAAETVVLLTAHIATELPDFGEDDTTSEEFVATNLPELLSRDVCDLLSLRPKRLDPMDSLAHYLNWQRYDRPADTYPLNPPLDFACERIRTLRSVANAGDNTATVHALDAALEAVRALDQTVLVAEGLIDIIPSAPRSRQSALIREALATTRDTRPDGVRADAFRGLLPFLLALPRPQCFALWRGTLHVLARRQREGLLQDVPALAPLIHAFGGSDAVKECIEAVLDAERWWP
jgi:hypothetical protein